MKQLEEPFFGQSRIPNNREQTTRGNLFMTWHRYKPSLAVKDEMATPSMLDSKPKPQQNADDFTLGDYWQFPGL